MVQAVSCRLLTAKARDRAQSQASPRAVRGGQGHNGTVFWFPPVSIIPPVLLRMHHRHCINLANENVVK